MPFQRGLAVGGLDLIPRRGARHAQDFVKITLVSDGIFFYPLLTNLPCRQKLREMQ